MKLTGKLIKGVRVIKTADIEIYNENAAFRDLLEECLIKLCKKLDILVPIWLKKNTSEFVICRRTSFAGEQFIEDINFDRFEIRLD